jgi:hypothetical protein
MWKRSRSETTRDTLENLTCCSCLEDNLPHLLYTGCSNEHVMCHMCSRRFIGGSIVMNKFPKEFPGKINHRQTLKCPMCKEDLNGISNLFVFDELIKKNTKKLKLEIYNEPLKCPHMEVLNKEDACSLGCKVFETIKQLQTHLISKHNNSVQCPSCSEWLSDPEKNTEDLLMYHILKKCVKINCQGCDRQSTMVNMYMHSSIGRDNVCNNSKDIFSSFGDILGDSFQEFSGIEKISDVSSTMLWWTGQYIYIRGKKESLDKKGEDELSDLGVEKLGKTFHQLFSAFVFKAFHSFHENEDGQDDDFSPIDILFSLIQKNNKEKYDEFILVCLSVFSKRYDKRLDQICQLPVVYRMLMMSLSNFSQAKSLYKKYPKKMTEEEKEDVNNMVNTFERVLTKNKSPNFQFTIPSHLLGI